MEFDLLLAVVLAVSVVTDLRSRKIYNKVLVPTWIAAVALHAGLEGGRGVVLSLLGCTVGLALLLVPYFMGGMGAGDVKLLAVIGAIKGTGFVLLASLGMAMIGALLAVFVLLLRAEERSRLVWFAYCGYGWRCGVRLPLCAGLGRNAFSAAYPYGVAIAGGAVLSWWLQGWGPL